MAQAQVEKTSSDWLSLGEASRLLGIHPATLRHWADHGAVPIFLTPGGHRRFALKDLQALIAQPPALPPPEKYLEGAIRQAREVLSSTAVLGERWYTSLSEQEKEGRRESGRRLLGLLLQYLANGKAHREKALDEAKRVIGLYGVDAVRHGLTTQELAKAFLFFRDFLLESVFHTEEGSGERGRRTYQKVNRFLNELLLAMLDAYEQASG